MSGSVSERCLQERPRSGLLQITPVLSGVSREGSSKGFALERQHERVPLSEDVDRDAKAVLPAYCGRLVDPAPSLRVAGLAGETTRLATKGLDGNVLKRDRPTEGRLVAGEARQADRAGGVPAVVQTEPLASAGSSRHAVDEVRRAAAWPSGPFWVPARAFAERASLAGCLVRLPRTPVLRLGAVAGRRACCSMCCKAAPTGCAPS